MTFTVPGFAGGDLVVAANTCTDADAALPSGVPRVLTVRVTTRRHEQALRRDPLPRDSRLCRAICRAGDVQVQFAFPPGPAAQVRSVRVHAAADAGYRLFDNGAVFVNPSLHPHTFDVGSLGSYVRLTATAGQDSTVNDGSSVGSSLTVAPTDAIVVRRAARP